MLMGRERYALVKRQLTYKDYSDSTGVSVQYLDEVPAA
jgi:hypothetical protein